MLVASQPHPWKPVSRTPCPVASRSWKSALRKWQKQKKAGSVITPGLMMMDWLDGPVLRSGFHANEELRRSQRFIAGEGDFHGFHAVESADDVLA